MSEYCDDTAAYFLLDREGRARQRCLPMRLAAVALVFLAGIAPRSVPAQSRAGDLVRAGRAELAAHHLEAADSLLRAALDSGSGLEDIDRQGAYVWLGITEYYRGNDSLTQVAFRSALLLNIELQVEGLAKLDPHLAELFEQERQAVRNGRLVYLVQDVDERPQRLSGPPLRYPAGAPAHLTGVAIVTVVVDTLGRVEPTNIGIVSIPDTAFVNPVKEQLRGSQFSVGRLHGRAVRTEVGLSIPIQPVAVNPVELTTQARSLVAARRPDSALALLRLALDSSAHPTEAARVYGLLVRGMAWKGAGRDSLATADIASGLAGYRDLTARGVDLAPFLRRLADSLSHAHRPRPDPFQSLTVTGPVDQIPILHSHPAVHYPPEAKQLDASGTVTVEAVIDRTGHVEAGSAKIVQSANPIFNSEALRVVSAAVYHPGRRGGQAVAVTIQQPITFTNY